MDNRNELAKDLLAGGEEHFQIAMQAERVMFWIAGADGACELLSGNWTGRTGQALAQALGNGWLAQIDDEDRAVVAETLRHAIVAQSGFYLRYRLLGADRRPRWILHDASPRFLPSGKFNGLLGTLSDCGDNRAGERALETSAQRVYSFVDSISLGAVAIDMDGRVVHANPVLCRLLGRTAPDLLGRDWIEPIVTGADGARVRSLINGETALSELPSELEYSIETPTGIRLFRWHLTLIRDFDGRPVSLTMMGNDITQWRRLGDSARLSARVFDTSNEAMLITDRSNTIVSVNESFTRLTGYAADEVIGKNPRLLRSGQHEAEFYRAMWIDLLTKGYWRGDIWDRRKDGSLYPKYLAISTIRDEKGEITHFSAIFHDVSERKAWEDKLDHLAHFDELTDLPNRALLQDRLEQAIAAAERHGQKFALLFIDLDGFKPVNDNFGHAFGDEVLRAVADRLRNAIRGMDTAARLGGDEFVVILTHIPNVETAAQVAEKLAVTLAEPYELAGRRVDLSASIGVSLYPQDELAAHGLLRTADEAMYVAKRDGKHRVSFYSNVA